ncbi:MAG: D-tyrosyl-tRNA(Tyr) deacylase [Fimbriimonadaceae bacterium]|nr:D-tyrosyl-tRNA(Tyr) deacylase [Fimbriimonadaceae bacterium]
MKAVVQRVLEAQVDVEGKTVGQIGKGLLVLCAAHANDTEREANKLADKVSGLRIFNDADGKMNLALRDVGEPVGILAISNFTVYGDARKSRRPSFTEAAPYEKGELLFARFVEELKSLGHRVETGVFGADMKVKLTNDGPVTILLEVEPGPA